MRNIEKWQQEYEKKHKAHGLSLQECRHFLEMPEEVERMGAVFSFAFAVGYAAAVNDTKKGKKTK